MSRGSVGFSKLYDDIRDHPKARRAGFAALGLWTCGLAYCSRFATDGVIRKENFDDVAPWADRKTFTRQAKKLVDAGLWELTEDGHFVMHDYDEHQRTADVIKAYRQKNADRMRTKREQSVDESPTESQQDANEMATESRHNADETPGGVERNQAPADDVQTHLARAREELRVKSKEIRDISELHALEQLGFDPMGSLGGSTAIALRRMLPITRDEFDLARKTTGKKSWGYFAKVLASMRDAPAAEAPRSGARPAPKSYQYPKTTNLIQNEKGELVDEATGERWQ